METLAVAVPTRTCIGCRQRAAATELVRLTLADGQVVPRALSGRAGRGASIHPREACVVAAIKTHAFARAFKTPISSVPGSRSKTEAARDVSGKTPDDIVRALIRDIEVAHMLQQPRAGRTS